MSTNVSAKFTNKECLAWIEENVIDKQKIEIAKDVHKISFEKIKNNIPNQKLWIKILKYINYHLSPLTFYFF
jgi:hypothetical protein